MEQPRLIQPYLNFQGNSEEAINFYKSKLGGVILTLQKFKDTPHGEKMSEADRDKVMHISLKLKDGTTLMASDVVEGMGGEYIKGNNFSLAVNPESEGEADRIFNGLSEGGEVTMPLQKTFWNAYFGMLNDKYGIQWMINYVYPAEK
jgi:PhnB protein